MSEQPKDTTPLYALTEQQVAFIRQLFEIFPMSGNRQQVTAILMKMAEVEAVLNSPVMGKDK